MSGALTITPAGSSDVDAVLPVHERAFAGSMGVALGRPYLRPFLRRFVDQPGRVFLVAREGADPVGYVFGRPVDSADGRSLLLAAAAGLLTHPAVLLRSDIRAELLRRMRPSPPATPGPALPTPVLSLVGIGTAPEARGRGVASMLMDAFQAEVVARGFASARLSVYRHNEAARRLYERQGWEPLDHPTNPGMLYYAWVPAA